MIDSTEFAPDWLSPPGDTIEDRLEELGWSKAELAQRMGFTAKHVNELVKGRVPITADAAERLSRVLGSTADFWLVRDTQYQAALERRRAIESAKADAGWLNELPLAWMRKHRWVESLPDKGAQVIECLRFFGVASVDAWRAQYGTPLAAFRASEKHEKRIGAIAAWLRKGEIETVKIECQAFDKVRLRANLTEIRALTTEAEPEVFMPRLVELCASSGVSVAFVPAPKGCPVSGATQWLTASKAMLLLSLRHRSNDHLWFTVFHEIAHLLLHGKKMLFIEGLDPDPAARQGLNSDHEREADALAGKILISDDDARRLSKLARPNVAKTEIIGFAQEIGIAPGIVVGRMQKEGWIPWSHLNGLKTRYEWADETEE
jgi:HTH-type transcriptional regulator/antitoxin HigA